MQYVHLIRDNIDRALAIASVCLSLSIYFFPKIYLQIKRFFLLRNAKKLSSQAKILGEKDTKEAYRSASSGYRKAHYIFDKLEDTRADKELENYAWISFKLYKRFNEKVSLENAIIEIEKRIATIDQYDDQKTWGWLKLLAGTIHSESAKLSSTNEQFNIAEKHFSEALTIVEKKSNLDLWSRLQNNLGITLFNLGRKTMSQPTLHKAISAFDESRSAGINFSPREIATISLNIANVFSELYELTSNIECCYTAKKYHKENLKKFTLESSQDEYFCTRISLGQTLYQIGHHLDSKKDLKIAAIFMKHLLNRIACYNNQTQISEVENNLSLAMKTLGIKNDDTNMIKQAFQLIDSSIKKISKINAPFEWAMRQYNKGNTAIVLARKGLNINFILIAIDSFKSSLEIITEQQQPQWWNIVNRELYGAYELLEEKNKNI